MRAKILKTSVAQLSAERLLGMRQAHRIHQQLLDLKIARIPICEDDTHRRVRKSVWWGPAHKDDSYREDWGCSEGDAPGRNKRCSCWTHLFTDYQPIWHVELRDPSTRCPTPEEFLWLGISLLTLPDVYEIPHLLDEGCISIWPGAVQKQR